MKRLITLLIPLLTVIGVYAIPEVKVYSNGDYGMVLDGTISINNSMESIPEHTIVDEDGNLYMVATFKGGILPNGDKLPSSYTEAIIKFTSDGECVWAKAVPSVTKFIEFDGNLLLTVWAEENGFSYDGVTRKQRGEYSEFLLKINKEDGKVMSELEIELDNVMISGQGSFPFSISSYCGMTVSPDGDLWFMLDVKPEFKGLNAQTPVTIKRFGDNDKCLIRLTSDLEFKQAIGIGSDSDDEVDFLKGECPRLVQNLFFVGDTLFCHIPFGGESINISFDEAKPVIVNRKKGWRCVASAAFCKYLLKDDKLELLSYRVINEQDDQAKRYFVNSQNQVIVAVPYAIWDQGDESFYMLNSDMSFRELDGYAFHSVRSTGDQKAMKIDRSFNILKMENYDFVKRKYSEDTDALEIPTVYTFRCAKYDKDENLHWIFEFPSLDGYPYTPECNVDPDRGYYYLCFFADVDVDIDMSEASDVRKNERIIARYIETYRIKSSSEHATIEVNGGNDMVRHREDAEVVITPEAGFHIESVSTAKGDKVDFSWDGRCSIKNVKEPIELVITTGDGANSVDQVDAVVLGVYPNPVKDILNVDDAEGSSYEVIDLAGNVASAGIINSGKIATSQLAKGTYVLTIKKEIGAYSTKIIKE